MPLSTVIAEFYLHPVLQGAESEKAGREIYKDVEYVRIIFPGNNLDIHEAPVTDKHRKEFAEVYRKWKETGQIVHEGTPLSSWPVMSPAKIKELNAVNVYTVEHIAGLDDHRGPKTGMGWRELKRQAEAFLATAAQTGPAQALAAENERLKADMKQLQDQVLELSNRLDVATKKEAA